MTPPPPAEPAWKRSFFEWFPWEKLTIWGLFLLVVYSLRHFFFTIFMTFIVAYSLRSMAGWVSRIVSPHTDRVWLQRLLVTFSFALLLLGLYTGGAYLVPALSNQVSVLVSQVGRLDPQDQFDKLLQKTVGAYLFDREVGSPGDETYDEEYARYLKDNPDEGVAYNRFRSAAAEIQRDFDATLREEETRRIMAARASQEIPDEAFDDWFLRHRAPALFNRNREEYIAEWEERVRASLGEEGLESFKTRPDWEGTRNERIQSRILDEAKATPESMADLKTDWITSLIDAAVLARRASPEYQEQFEEHYTAHHDSSPELRDHDIEKFRELKATTGREAFLAVLGADPELDEEDRRELFREDKQKVLAANWWEGNPASQIKNAVVDYGSSALTAAGIWVRDALTYILTIPIQLTLSLLLAFFIALDVPKMRRSLSQLRRSRVGGFYEEIAPGMISFGRLIGRAFQAQGVIAFFNTVLTFAGIKVLGINNEFFLCAIVFVCSFIPIVGVVMSTIPIAIVALFQDDGSLGLAVAAVIAILLIHFVETWILNPKILGDMLHLHPVLVLAVLTIGGHFFGVWGLLLAVPVTVYIIRFVIFDEGIPGVIDPVRFQPIDRASGSGDEPDLEAGGPGASPATAASAPAGPPKTQTPLRT